jgi:uncharacterized membrane protein YqaE (UPF0057 family)
MTGAPGRPGIGAIVAAILLPPLGVWIAEGLGVVFLLSLVLTCLGYVPGMIFSLVAVLRPDMMAPLRSNRA